VRHFGAYNSVHKTEEIFSWLMASVNTVKYRKDQDDVETSQPDMERCQYMPELEDIDIPLLVDDQARVLYPNPRQEASEAAYLVHQQLAVTCLEEDKGAENILADVQPEEQYMYKKFQIRRWAQPPLTVVTGPWLDFTLPLNAYDLAFDRVPVLLPAPNNIVHNRPRLAPTSMFGHALCTGGVLFVEIEFHKPTSTDMNNIERLKALWEENMARVTEIYPQPFFKMVNMRLSHRSFKVKNRAQKATIPVGAQFVFVKVKPTLGDIKDQVEDDKTHREIGE
jgi:hypothetical protein